MGFGSLKEILAVCEQYEISFCEAVLRDDISERGVTQEESVSEMNRLWQQMKLSANSYDRCDRSASGLSGGDGGKMRDRADAGCISGGFMGKVIASALEMGECNACMKRIVAAPTAGSCGVLPAVLINYANEYDAPEEKIVEALYTAAGIGQVIAERASIAGATGGCQAEIGTASAMAAGAVVYLSGGDSEAICHAAAMALKNLMGLVCDPVGGLVEVPCVKRNVIGAINAISAADMALAGIKSKILPDDVIDAMKDVGDKMHSSLRETGEGGVAGTHSAREQISKMQF
ncbi:MAG: L-serine ammonia-lyase, iron-sulfur-dependent, subunit alpha [Oscillospiraceae bacterium]|nr:L-serine ammonia-lyase, iron-sulfur-dependent, subunit alpha [Oscillospiraceae bacterium]